MKKVLTEGLDLAQQMAALPFKAARQVLAESTLKNRAVGEVIAESLSIGENAAKLPFKAAAALIDEMAEPKPNLEERVAKLEEQVSQPTPGSAT